MSDGELSQDLEARQAIDRFVDFIARTPNWICDDSCRAYFDNLFKQPLELVDYFWDRLQAKREAAKRQLAETEPTNDNNGSHSPTIT